MVIDDSILGYDERIGLALRGLYCSRGYRPFKMSKFEEYDLYSKNKDFLASDGILTFNDTDGKLLALKPDVTLSIIRSGQDLPGQVRKLCYTENVYRISQTSHTYKEILQTGLECIGDITPQDTAQVVHLAMESAAMLSPGYRVTLSHVGLVEGYLADLGIPEDSPLRQAIRDKNRDGLRAHSEALLPLLEAYPGPEELKSALGPHIRTRETRSALEAFCSLWQDLGREPRLWADLSLTTTRGYYSGIVFQCCLPGIAQPVISGGQYDGLMARLGRSAHALGFAVYLDALERLEDRQEDPWLNIALPKGRLGEKVYDLFERSGFGCPGIREDSRKLIFENSEQKLRFFWVKPSDVAIYVARGAADMGVAGSDILMEQRPEVYELCDLGLGKCRMAVAAQKDFQDDHTRQLRVATKFSRIAREYYARQCRDIDIIHLNGSIELAPILGLSDVIVDIVETGKTLLENGLEPRETIANISARLIANKAAYGFQGKTIESIRAAIAKQVKQL